MITSTTDEFGLQRQDSEMDRFRNLVRKYVHSSAEEKKRLREKIRGYLDFSPNFDELTNALICECSDSRTERSLSRSDLYR